MFRSKYFVISFFMLSIFLCVGKANAGWSSAMIIVCDSNGCVPVNQPVYINPPSCGGWM